MKTKLIVILLVVVLLLATTPFAVFAQEEEPEKKPGKFNEKGEVTDWLFDPGFDPYGYNYNAEMFSGYYCRYLRGEYDPENPLCRIDLIMKWSTEWLSRVDTNGDGKLDRGFAECRGEGTNLDLNQSHCPGAWLTNHMRGEYVGDDGKTCKWTYLTKILYPGYMPQDVNPVDGLDDASENPIIWGAFITIQTVENDTCNNTHGVQHLAQPAGFGAW